MDKKKKTVIQKRFILFLAVLCYLFCFFSLPEPAASRNLQPPTPASSDDTYDGQSQQNEIEDFFVRFNGCSWARTPGDPFRDVYFELKGRTLVLYEYIKDEFYCQITFSICFAQQELWRMEVTGYDNAMTDRHGNRFRVVIGRNGETITMYGMEGASGREDVIGTFVKFFCSENP